MTDAVRPSRDLQSLQRSALARTGRLYAYMNSMLAVHATPNPLSVDNAVAFVIIELDNLWASVARSFYLSVAFCARDGTGKHVQLSKTTRAQSTDEALAHAIRRCKPRLYKSGLNRPLTWRDEPPWWKPRTLLDAIDEIGASNYQQVSAAMSVSPTAFSYLHTFRNFYAHRNRVTRTDIVGDLRRLQFPTNYTATTALTSPTVWQGQIRPQPLVLDWLDDIQNTILLLV